MKMKKFLICLPLMLDISIKRINLYNLIKHELKNKKIKEY